jgi:cytochrome c5
MKLIAGGLLVLATMGMASTAMAADGKAVYDQTCALCHAAGVAGAPKFGDKAAWAPRLATGKAALVASVIKGKGAMPAKAGNANLKDDEIAAAVDYIAGAAK